MTYYILEPEDDWANGYIYVNADTDEHARKLAEQERPTLNFKILGDFNDLKQRIDQEHPKIHDTTVEEQ